MDTIMKKLTQEELNQRASDKAFSKIFFLEEDLKLNTHNRLYPPNLYKGVLWENNHNLFTLVCKINFILLICLMLKHGLLEM